MNNSSSIHIENEIENWSYFGCGLATIFMNCLVLYIAFRYIDFRTKPSQIFVVSMTMADLFFGFTFLGSRPFLKYFSLTLCGPYYIILWACQISSVLFLLYLNIDKFISLYWPLHYPSIVTERLVAIPTVISWLILIGFPSYS